MRQLLTSELARMRDTQVDVMWDVCQIGSYTETTNALNELVVSYTWGDPTRCHFIVISEQERSREQYSEVRSDALIRLELGTDLTARDKVRIVARNQTPSTVQEYGVVGEPMVRETVLEASLQRLEVP